jgi:Ca-activated chloride channel family protein
MGVPLEFTSSTVRKTFVSVSATLFWVCSAAAQIPGLTQPQPQGQPTTQQRHRPLTVDRDPAPSIDPDTPALATPATPVPSGTGQVGKDQTGRYTLQADAYEIQLHVTVVDSSGRAADYLQKDAFRVSEDGVPQAITGFRHEDLPVSIGLLIDSSASMWDKREAVEQAALDLIRLSNAKDEAFLVDFSSKAYIDQDFTSSPEDLKKGLRYVKSIGGTAAYDAVMASAQYMSRHGKNTKQVLLLITDGEDNASRTSMADMIRRVQSLDGPVVYCVGLLFGQDTDKVESRRARSALENLANQTGGVAFFPKSLKEVDKIAAIVAQDIRTQYTIGYRSTNPPQNGGFRAVHVDAFSPENRKLSVRTRNGYIAKGLSTTPAAPTAATRPNGSPAR